MHAAWGNPEDDLHRDLVSANREWLEASVTLLRLRAEGSADPERLAQAEERQRAAGARLAELGERKRARALGAEASRPRLTS